MAHVVPPLIALEEHFFSSAITVDDKYVEQLKAIPGVSDKLRDLGDLRLQDMAKGRISLQVISHAPAAPDTSAARQANDELAEAVGKHKDRFAGFAVLPVGSPEDCGPELERCVRQLGFVGALIDNHSEGQCYDGEEYLPMWQMAEALDVPVYLHPTWPSTEMNARYTGNFTDGAARSLGASGWGWHSETGLHVLRLFASGLFDKCPKLKIIIGHFGEMIPYMLHRIIQLSVRWGKRDRGFKEVYEQNIWITTSGVWSLDPLRCILANTPIDHILYSVDYPFAANEWGLAWIEDLMASGLVTSEQLDMIAHQNAEKLLGVKAPRDHRS